MEADDQTLVIRGSRRKAALAVLGTAALAACGVWMLSDAFQSSRYPREMTLVVGWVSVSLFGFFTVLLAIQTFFPPTLVLTPQGFTLTSWTRRVVVNWTSVRQVFLVEAGRVGSVNWHLNDNAPERGAISDFSRMAGSVGSAGGGWTLSSQQVVNTMEDFRRRFGRPDSTR